MSFEILETLRFKQDLEEATMWLYSHNMEQSQEFADQKFLELGQEINSLKTHLKKNPNMGQADEISGIRRFPVYGGRYVITWIINENVKSLTLLEFIDSKNPKELRAFYFDE